jgi:hypothetical protein
MGETPREIEQHIHVARVELGNNLNELETRIRDATNWRTHVNRKPLTMVAVAFGAGVVLAALIGGRRSRSRERMGYYENEHSSARPLREHRRSEARDRLGKIGGALMGVAADRALHFLSDMIPGFRRNYDRMHQRSAASIDPDEAGTVH